MDDMSTLMPAESVTKLLTSKGGDAWVKTLRKAVLAARDGRDRYVGFTYTSYYIETSAGPGLRFIARANGDVEKVTQ